MLFASGVILAACDSTAGPSASPASTSSITWTNPPDNVVVAGPLAAPTASAIDDVDYLNDVLQVDLTLSTYLTKKGSVALRAISPTERHFARFWHVAVTLIR